MARQFLRSVAPTASMRDEVQTLARLIPATASAGQKGLAFQRCFRRARPGTPKSTFNNYTALLTHVSCPNDDHHWTIKSSFTTCIMNNANMRLLGPNNAHSSVTSTRSSSQRFGDQDNRTAAPVVAETSGTSDVTPRTSLASLFAPLKPSISVAILAKAITSWIPSRLFASTASKGKTSVDEILAKRKSEARAAQRKIEEDLTTSKVVVYGKQNCKFSVKAKRALEDVGCKDYKWVDICADPEKKAVLLAVLSSLTNSKPKVPKVFISKKYVGGGNECERLRDSGALSKLIKD